MYTEKKAVKERKIIISKARLRDYNTQNEIKHTLYAYKACFIIPYRFPVYMYIFSKTVKNYEMDCGRKAEEKGKKKGRLRSGVG